jgi:hypothetical protein
VIPETAISALLGAIVGGSITFLTSYFLETRRDKLQEQREQEQRKSELLNERIEAYANVLSGIAQLDTGMWDKRMEIMLNLNLAKAFIYGSSEVQGIIKDHKFNISHASALSNILKEKIVNELSEIAER